jgi:hypothetical protein
MSKKSNVNRFTNAKAAHKLMKLGNFEVVLADPPEQEVSHHIALRLEDVTSPVNHSRSVCNDDEAPKGFPSWAWWCSNFSSVT